MRVLCTFLSSHVAVRISYRRARRGFGGEMSVSVLSDAKFLNDGSEEVRALPPKQRARAG